MTQAETQKLAVARGLSASGGAVTDLVNALASEAGKTAFSEWARNPVTVMVRDALTEIALSPPTEAMPSDDRLIQYGVTIGLGIASRLLRDFSQTLFQQSGKPKTSADVPMDFSTEPV